MTMDDVAAKGLVLLGCGKMGSAMLAGWLDGGLPPGAVHVIDPAPSEWLRARGVHLNGDLPASPAIVLIAVKPQMMGEALPAIAEMGNGETLFISVAAGTPVPALEAALGAGSPIIRAMPNTPRRGRARHHRDRWQRACDTRADGHGRYPAVRGRAGRAA